MLESGTHYIYAEYCPGDLFWGWWLYGAPVIDEVPDRTKATWLHADYWLSVLYRALDLPTQLDYRHTPYVERFLQRYPSGAVIEVGGFYDWRLLECDHAWAYLRRMREAQLLDWKDSSRKASSQKVNV